MHRWCSSSYTTQNCPGATPCIGHSEYKRYSLSLIFSMRALWNSGVCLILKVTLLKSTSSVRKWKSLTPNSDLNALLGSYPLLTYKMLLLTSFFTTNHDRRQNLSHDVVQWCKTTNLCADLCACLFAIRVLHQCFRPDICEYNRCN